MANLEILLIPVSAFQQNARILYNSSTKDAVVVDPGGDAEIILAELVRHKLNLQAIWLTHSHLDHCGGVADLLSKLPVPLYAHANEKEFRENVVAICQSYGIPSQGMKNCPEPSNFIQHEDVLEFLGNNFKVIFCPGHSPGHVCFYCKEENLLIAGDTIFAGSIGRTDLPGGNHQELLDNIKQKLLGLPGETRVLSGHGPDTTIAVEKSTNPWLISRG